MPRINLLPWREERRKRRQKQFNTSSIGVAILAALVVGYWHHTMSANIDYQNQRNRYLQTQISSVDKRIKDIKDLKETRKELLARMRIIEQLQQSRPQIVHLFDQLVRTLPDGIFLTSVNEQGDTLHINGIAQSSARISTYMRNIADSDWLADPNLTVIKATGKGPLHRKQFTLSATITGPSKGKESKG
ncbi:MAG TPA: PilN domain-containing protein [Gammaproteobacteria bacterium]|nr:PilN domain-containing protein [Gammaproteobacteria bacterium]